VGGLFLLGGIGSVLTLVFPIVLVLALLVILALRHDDDADERRAPAIYGSIIAFVGTLTALYAATGVVAQLLELTKDGADRSDTVTMGVILLIVVVSAGALLYVHQTLFDLRHGASGAARRVHRAYVLVECLVTALTAMVAGGLLLFQVYGLLSPDDAGTTRADALRVGLTMAALLAGSVGLWRWHWRQLDLSPAATAP
jgi:hypothetical protein